MTISTEGVGNFTSIQSGATAAAPKQTMDSEMFLNLLVAQLKYQDPSSPMDTTEMMAQTTQLASMEQLTSIADASLESFALQMRSTATQFVGRTVTYTDDKGETVTGEVESVSFAGSVPELTIGGKKVTLDSVSGIVSAATTPADKSDKTSDSSAS